MKGLSTRAQITLKTFFSSERGDEAERTPSAALSVSESTASALETVTMSILDQPP